VLVVTNGHKYPSLYTTKEFDAYEERMREEKIKALIFLQEGSKKYIYGVNTGRWRFYSDGNGGFVGKDHYSDTNEEFPVTWGEFPDFLKFPSEEEWIENSI
jgi:hypothetical protein